MQAKAVTACTECHEARIIVQQRLSKAAWTKEVDKMMKWGAVVEPQDRDALIDYLSGNFPVDKPEYVAERSRGPAAGAGRSSSAAGRQQSAIDPASNVARGRYDSAA